MTASEDKFTPGTWIPWIVALSFWLGWNGLAPDHLAGAKKISGEEIGLVHQSDDLPAPVVHPRPLAELVPVVSGSGLFLRLPSQRLGIEVLRELPAEDPRWGGIQGRAPPVEA
ncbi:hypothetical protein [Haloferula sp. BvORR071]|uniref:hypothetical protein n=1 Tax=Haloferula sp. BvORR071 TaxID=1396141 RepID=UPI000551E1D7|nr:hypothetical protein [Haloferula sp. BvORR071]